MPSPRSEPSPRPSPERADHRSLLERGRDIRRDASSLRRDVEGAARDVEASIAASMRERPYLTCAAAAAAGYVLGGGLATRATRAALAVGGRMLVALAVQEAGRLTRVGATASSPTENKNRRIP